MNKKFLQISTLILSLPSIPAVNAVILENASTYSTARIYLVATVEGAPISYTTATYNVYNNSNTMPIPSDTINEAWTYAKAHKKSVNVVAYVEVIGTRSYVPSSRSITLKTKTEFDHFNSNKSKLIFTGINQQNQAVFAYQPKP